MTCYDMQCQPNWLWNQGLTSNFVRILPLDDVLGEGRIECEVVPVADLVLERIIFLAAHVASHLVTLDNIRIQNHVRAW
jgi:hypothetical protein